MNVIPNRYVYVVMKLAVAVLILSWHSECNAQAIEKLHKLLKGLYGPCMNEFSSLQVETPIQVFTDMGFEVHEENWPNPLKVILDGVVRFDNGTTTFGWVSFYRHGGMGKLHEKLGAVLRRNGRKWPQKIGGKTILYGPAQREEFKEYVLRIVPLLNEVYGVELSKYTMILSGYNVFQKIPNDRSTYGLWRVSLEGKKVNRPEGKGDRITILMDVESVHGDVICILYSESESPEDVEGIDKIHKLENLEIIEIK